MYSIFRNLALILISAKFFALLARKCRAPQVVGEIIAGLVIGPCLLNLVQPSDSIAIFAGQAQELPRHHRRQRSRH